MNTKRVFLLSVLCLLGMSITYANSHKLKNHVLKNSQASKSGIKGVCNGDPVAYIIRNHPDLLTHKRDKVLRTGAKKSNQYSLQGCVNCHASKKVTTQAKKGYHPINESGQFCATCHDKTATSLDCFECHRTTPYEGKTYYKKIISR